MTLHINREEGGRISVQENIDVPERVQSSSAHERAGYLTESRRQATSTCLLHSPDSSSCLFRTCSLGFYEQQLGATENSDTRQSRSPCETRSDRYETVLEGGL